MKTKLKIESVRIEKVADTNPDTSWLGSFTDKAIPECFIRNGEHAGKLVKDVPADELPDKGREFRFFLPGPNHVPHDPKSWAHVADATKAACIAKHGSLEAQDLDYARQDWQRMEALARDDWYFVGIIAKAVITSFHGIEQTIRSGGVWGVESDCGQNNMQELADNELASLREELLALGFKKRQIDYAFRQVSNQ